jgi:hypothetical protein
MGAAVFNHGFRDHFQYRVPDLVAKGIVYLFKVIQVRKYYPEGPSEAL